MKLLIAVIFAILLIGCNSENIGDKMVVTEVVWATNGNCNYILRTSVMGTPNITIIAPKYLWQVGDSVQIVKISK